MGNFREIATIYLNFIVDVANQNYLTTKIINHLVFLVVIRLHNGFSMVLKLVTSPDLDLEVS